MSPNTLAPPPKRSAATCGPWASAAVRAHATRWDAKGYHDVVKTLEDSTSLTPAKPQTPRSRKAKPTDAPFQEATGFDRPLNAILYGPPGTGKTYATARRCVEI